MRVSLIQADPITEAKMPNIALMKLSSYHKSQGDTVGMNLTHPDLMYISCVFSKNLPQAYGIPSMYPGVEYLVGGPALGVPNHLPDYAEHLMPDYTLYDIDYSIGKTQVGCINNCGFCIVHKLEPVFKEYAEIKEFHHPDHRKIVLYDNNFLASTLYQTKLDYINENGLKVNFNQGLDARLVDEKAAGALADTKAYNFHFNHRYYHFAWDLVENSERILQGLENMINAGVSPRNLMVYVLVGYNSTHQQDWDRVEKLIDMKMDPFIMKYNHRKDDTFLNHLARWCNQPALRKKFSFKDYDRLSRADQVEVSKISINKQIKRMSEQ